MREQVNVKEELLDLKNKKILLIEDDVDLQALIHMVFSRSNAQIYRAFNGKEGLRRFYADRPDLVILDLKMPEMDGWEVCRAIRRFSDVPIIMMTALNNDQDVIRGFNYGVDDYVTKPVSAFVLLVRVQALLRRTSIIHGPDERDFYEDDYLKIDISKHQVLVQGTPVNLTAKEYQVLAYLFQNSDHLVTLKQIMEKVWGSENQDSVDYVHVYISQLRRKLEPESKNSRYLLNEHGLGYRFMKSTS